MIRSSHFLLLGIVCTLLSACSPANNGSFSSDSASKTYTNTAIGFSVQVPAGWILPRSTDIAPIFSSSKECASDPSGCSTFQVTDDSTKFAIGPDATLTQLQAAGLQPTIIDGMIPGATVIAANPGMPSKTWFFAYHVFFADAHKLFLIQSSDSTLERTVLSIFTVSK